MKEVPHNNFKLESEEVNVDDTNQENRKIEIQDVQNIFTKGMVVEELELEIKEEPIP